MDIIQVIDHFANKYDDINLIRSITNSVNKNQRASKEWCVEHITSYLSMHVNNKVCIAAGWYGLLGHMLNDYDITTFDMDPLCKEVGKKLYPELNHITSQIEDFNPKEYGTIICTSCEHITDDVLNNFLSKRSTSSIVCLQSNDYFGVDGHVNCKKSLEEFIDSVNIVVLEKFAFKTKKYTRFMVIGR